MTVELKSSGISFIGDIPAHWDIASVKRLYSIQLGKMLQNHAHGTDNINMPYLKAKNVQWFTVNPPVEQSMWATPNEMIQFGVRNGDLLVCEGGEGGRCGIAKNIHSPCIIQNALYRVRPINDSSNEYLLYAIYTIAATGWLNAINDKATIAHFTNEKFSTLKIPVPPPDEQAAIVRFLNSETKKIESATVAKEETLSFLEEQKQRVINHAITRGLNSSVSLKPSGFSFIDDIPEHWKIIPIKYCMSKFYSGGTPDSGNANYYCAFGKGVPWLMIADMTGQRYIYHTQTAITEKGIISKKLELLPAGTILISMYASIGTTAILKIDAAVNQAIIGMCPDNKILDTEYCLYCIENMQPYIVRFTDSSTQANLNSQKVRDLPVIIPPLSEQKNIAKYLNKTTTKITAAIKCIRREISLLHEYRTCLIADVVTGKIDVRNFTKSSPKGRKQI